jgi:hypothetical protein
MVVIDEGSQLTVGESAIAVGNLERQAAPPSERVTAELRSQCTTCGYRFDCSSYREFVVKKGGSQGDVDLCEVRKN